MKIKNLPDDDDDEVRFTNRLAWRATYSLTASSLIKHTQHLLPDGFISYRHLLPWSPARPISISQLLFSLCLSFMSWPSPARSMCSSPLCLSINYETDGRTAALTNTVIQNVVVWCIIYTHLKDYEEHRFNFSLMKLSNQNVCGL